jgi:hypothetical protein
VLCAVQAPAPSTLDQLHAEATAVATVAYSHCPIHAVLDRIVTTHTGTIMALWQVSNRILMRVTCSDSITAAELDTASTPQCEVHFSSNN